MQKRYRDSGNLQECIELYDELQMAYAKNGYPLECAYNERLYTGYRDLYENVREGGTRLLQTVYDRKNTPETETMFRRMGIDPCPYSELIKLLTEDENDEMARVVYPFSVRADALKPGKNMIEWGGDWNRFLYDLAKCLKKANFIRNKLIHSPESLKPGDKIVENAINEMRDLVEFLEYLQLGEYAVTYGKRGGR